MSNTKVRYPAVEQFIDNNKDALVRSVQEIVRFPSVEAPAAGPGAPFGEAVRGALENALNLGKSFGFETTNLDGYAGCIDYGCGEEMLGVVAHVDVVPEGEGWIHPPYAAEIADGSDLRLRSHALPDIHRFCQKAGHGLHRQGRLLHHRTARSRSGGCGSRF